MRYTEAALREALALHTGVPLVTCDARVRQSALDVLVVLIEHALTRSPV